MKESPAKVSLAHSDYKELLKVLQLGRLAGVMLGKYLYRLKANNDYQKAVGEGINTWADFLKMPEISLDSREANRAMEIYEELCIKRGYSTEMVAEAGTKNLHYMLPMVKRGDLDDHDIKQLIEEGRDLPQASFRERLQDIKGGDRHYEFVLMRRCVETNNLQKVHDITSEQIVKAFIHEGINLTEQLMPEVI